MGALRRQGGLNLRDEHGVHAPQVTGLEVEEPGRLSLLPWKARQLG